MKKTLKLFLASWLCLFLLTGCNEKQNNQQNITKTNLFQKIEEEKVDLVKNQQNLSEKITESPSTENSLKTIEIKHQEQNFLVVKIDPKLYTFNIIQNEKPPHQKSILEIHQAEKSLLSFNGIFFTEKFQPTGLLISEGKNLSKFSKADLVDGVFTIDKQDIPILYNSQKFEKLNKEEKSKIDFAVQNGPTLIKNGKIMITEQSKKTASRTALGIDNQKNIILIVLRQSIFSSDNVLSLYDFANIIKENSDFKKLQIEELLNLDGGPSSGFALGEDYYPELTNVQNVIITKKR